MCACAIKKYHLHKGEPDKIQFEIFSLKDHLMQNASHTQNPHIHSFYQIIWFVKGSGKHYVDFKEYEVEDNTLFFISKGQVHLFDENIQEGCVIHFNESFLDLYENFTDIFLKHNIFHSFEKEPLFKIRESDSEELHCIVKQMQKEAGHTELFAHSEYLKLQLQMFLILVQRLGIRKDCCELTMNSPSHILFVNFRKLLEENFLEFHTVAKYAKMLCVSAKTLTNCTKGISNQTPLEIINDRLILEAIRLLSYSERNINEIGYELGFEDPSYFVKFFKRRMGVSPGDFRKYDDKGSIVR